MKQKQELVRLIEKEKIHFHGPEHSRPGNYAQVFTAIRELSKYRFDQYIHNFTYEAHQKPWRAKIKQQVVRVVRLAEDCSYARQNEFGWRLKLESEILARFSTEVTCKRCSSKLWRSEVEVFSHPSDTFLNVLDLEKRQADRKPCSCSEMQRSLDRDDHGICRVFHDRIDELVKYSEDDPMFGALPREQKPDRVYGFRKTSRFSRLLDDEISDPRFEGQELCDILECTPFDETRDQVLFPFLVLEAKKENGDSFDDIEIQTAFAIKKLLDIQLELGLATGERSQWQSGPLVWFLSNRGEEWRLAAAYVEMHGKRTHYHVYHLWSGSIVSKDAGLQLLLIMDYIFDWARDFQREAILSELRIFAGRNAASIADDSEVRTLGGHMQRFLDADFERCLGENRPDSQDSYAQYDGMYRWLDSEHCVFRSISWAHARVSALYITKENLETLLRSFTSKTVSGKHARDLLRLFREAWKVTPDALEALEFMWTGKQREDPDLYGCPQRFCAVFTVAAYFTSDWEQVSELTYIAIAENALDDLKAYVDLHQPIHVYPSELPLVQQEHLVGYFRHFRQSSARSKLHAAMRRCCLSSRLARESEFPESFFLVAEEPFDMGIRYRLDVTMLPDQNSKTRQLIAAVYNQCKRGMREREEPFLRMSSTYDSTPWDHNDMPSVWNVGDLPILEGALYMFLGSGKGSSNGNAMFCIYVMDDIPAPQAFPLSFDLLEAYCAVQTNQRTYLSGSQIEWNVASLTEPVSANSAMIKQLKEHFRDLVVYQESQLPPNAITEEKKRSTYPATKELPPHMRSNLKTPQDHWVITANPEDTYENFRTSADYLVARKNNVKLITCLYAQNKLAGRAGLGFDQRQSRTAWSLKEQMEEDGKTVGDFRAARKRARQSSPDGFEIRSIMQRGDTLRLRNPDSERKRGEEFDEKNTGKIFGAGDWLTDQELASNIRAGNFDNDMEPADRRTEHVRKRVRFKESERPSDAIDTSTEGPAILEKSPQEKKTDVLMGDHVTDEELEALLIAGYFGGNPVTYLALEHETS